MHEISRNVFEHSYYILLDLVANVQVIKKYCKTLESRETNFFESHFIFITTFCGNVFLWSDMHDARLNTRSCMLKTYNRMFRMHEL